MTSRNTNVLGLSDSKVTPAMLKELARRVVSESKRDGITQNHRLIQMINWATNPSNPGTWIRNYKSYFESLGTNPAAVLADLKERFPTIFGLPAQPDIQPDPTGTDPEQPSPLPANVTAAGFDLSGINWWWVGGGLAGATVLALILGNR